MKAFVCNIMMIKNGWDATKYHELQSWTPQGRSAQIQIGASSFVSGLTDPGASSNFTCVWYNGLSAESAYLHPTFLPILPAWPIAFPRGKGPQPTKMSTAPWPRLQSAWVSRL